jgi:glycosyltransferase involved in cell wall biosynthesis
MRIGFDATVLRPATRYTGMGEYAARLLCALSRVDDRNIYIAYGVPGSVPPAGLGRNVRWHTLPQVPLGKLAAPVRHVLALPVLALRHRLDLLHVPTVNIFASHPPVPPALPCPLVVTLHDLIPITYYHLRQPTGEPWPLKMRSSYRANLWAAQRAARIITVSESARREIVQGLRLPSARVVAIHHGMDFGGASADDGQTDTAVASIDRPYVLFSGSWEPRKNVVRLVQAYDLAMRRGLDRDLVLVVDRASGHETDAQAEIARISHRDRLHILHSVPEPALASLYRNADFFVFPSLAEGFGFPPLQAMACGTAAIASCIPALEEILGDTALYVDPKSVDSIAAGLVRLGSDEDLRRRLAGAGPPHAARYTWEEAARRTLAVYRAAARGGGGRPIGRRRGPVPP